jgi:nitrate/nitrite transporter NarK
MGLVFGIAGMVVFFLATGAGIGAVYKYIPKYLE